jgi:hypothetical protein
MLSQGSLRISLNGEDGVSYYLRNSENLDEWNLVDENPIQGTGNSATIDVNLDAPTEKKFFQMESRFERRARLFINNYNNQITIPGTNDYNTFVEFIEGMITRLNNNQLSAIADEFQTMQIEYPYTIRRYRGTPTTANNNGGDGTDTGTEINNRIQSVSPSSGSRGSSQTITIIFNGNTRPPLPPVNPNNVTVNGISLSNVTYNNSNSIVTGTLSLPNNATLGIGDVIVSFPTPNDTLSFISENSFSVTQ